MPIYEYQCLVCEKISEAMQKFSDAPLAVCPECGGQLKKLISNSSFVLKGTGWYKTDYAAKDTGAEIKTSENRKAEKTADTKTGSKAEDAKKAEPETKKETVAAS
ncbi:MAG: zinc ribbon domain-containing protein [Nitrospirae bacterium]|nr:zinc ribbon domain-containing protein [Nitrospirota bacterium]